MFIGRRVAAVILAVPALVVVALGAAQLSQGIAVFTVSLWDQSYCLAVLLGVGLLGLLRVAAVIHAFVSASGRRRPRPPEVAFLSVLLVVIVAMHGFVASSAWGFYDAGVSMNHNDLSAFAPDPEESDDPFADPTPWPTDMTPDPNSSATPTDSPTPRPTVPPATSQPRNPNRITFLLLGRNKGLTDTMIVFSLDKKTNKAAMISIPRDTANFDLYYGGWVGPLVKINTLLSAASSPKFGSPDPPIQTVEKEIGFLVGIPIDYAAVIDLLGFSKMIDAVGGVDVVNPKAINDPHTHTFVPAGPVHLDGRNALKYVRSREGAGDNDYTRARRQQDVLTSLARRVSSPSIVGQLGTLLSLASTYIATDFPLSTARNYVAAAEHISTIERCVLGPPYSYHPDASTTRGVYTSRLDLGRVASLSVEMFGQESRYYGAYGAVPAPCGK